MQPKKKRKKKKIQTVESKEERAVKVPNTIASRGGMKRELMFGQKGESAAEMSGVIELGGLSDDGLCLQGAKGAKGIQSKSGSSEAEGGQRAAERADRKYGIPAQRPGPPMGTASSKTVEHTGQHVGASVSRDTHPSTKIMERDTSSVSKIRSRKPLPDPGRHFGEQDCTERLERPRFDDTGGQVTGSKGDKRRLRKQNKRRRIERQLQQDPPEYWTQHTGAFTDNMERTPPTGYRGGMAPSNLALHHPAGPLLKEYSTTGCPVDCGTNWSRENIKAAIEFGNHPMEETAVQQFWDETLDKAKRGLVELIDIEELLQRPDSTFPTNLKSSPLSAVVHKSRGWRAILDLSWMLEWEGGKVPSVNEKSTKISPNGSIDQLGHVLQRLIYAMATAPDGKKVYAAKWDVKDGFWQMVCQLGAEWNFCYVLPEKDGVARTLVKPKSLQMGWIESPGFFGVASETARDVGHAYAQAPLGHLPAHKFEHFTTAHADFELLPASVPNADTLQFSFEVFVDDFIGLAVAESQEQLTHLSRAILHGIHDVFPATVEDDDDPNSVKKLKKLDGAWALDKDVLGFDFDGDERTIMLDKPKRDAMIKSLRLWVRQAARLGTNKSFKIPFKDFQRVVCQMRHACTCIPSGRGYLSVSEGLASADKKKTKWIFLRKGSVLFQELAGMSGLLQAATAVPTKCTELVTGWPHYIGIMDASTEGVAAVLVGEGDSIEPTVCRFEWPPEVRKLILCHAKNPKGKITNSDLECAGMLFLLLLIELRVPCLKNKHLALLSDNDPTVTWTKKLTSRKSKTAAALLRVMATRLKAAGASPLIPMHIAGVENAITDIPSRSFGRIGKWFCDSDEKFLTLFNSKFPLPNQNSWSVCHLPKDLSSKLVSVLLTQASEPAEWRRPSSRRINTGLTGLPMRNLWEWTLTCRKSTSSTSSKSELSQDTLLKSSLDTMATAARSSLDRSLQLSRPLARRYPWCGDTTH